jgi:hypothetical protein
LSKGSCDSGARISEVEMRARLAEAEKMALTHSGSYGMKKRENESYLGKIQSPSSAGNHRAV